MGNCLFAGGAGEIQGKIKVITSNGGIMELGSPITVGCIADEFPGYGIFKSHDLFWNPLPHNEELLPGKSYYLLPRNRGRNRGGEDGVEMGIIRAREGHVRSNSVPEAAAAMAAMAPYRMSFDYQGVLRRSQTEVFSRYSEKNGGVWKVKLVISPKRLVEILEEEGHTQELIESVRTVAKCGSTSTSSSFSSSMAFSDQWSLSTATANATPSVSSKSGGLLEI
ncbi:uncharacterized protein LOC101218947 [Cucumis sativus]|uniref:DUF4228 domain-containing protein n=1 Tax=Cucumis sativus TaxID=3659 RepID=A0A0A0KUU6_CUCSA|nr:uncharacterized protein LOC101218947 [Cucumis sativus]